MVTVHVSNKEESPQMDNGGYSGSQLVHHFRSVLDAVKTGDRGNYDELVSYLYPKRNLSPDEVAILVTTLKALSGAVSYIDSDHHESLLFAVSRMSLWNNGTEVMDALLELITSLAATNGKYIDWCLEMLVKHFVPPFYMHGSLDNENGNNWKNKVLSRVHAALEEIADLVPLAPLRLCPIVVQNMPSVFSNDREIVLYVENMLKLESGAIGETVGSTVLPALVDRLLELDVEIGWDGILQEDTRGIFDMELEDIIKFAEEDENSDSMPQSELFNRENLQGKQDKKVVEKLDNLIVLALLHLESCQSSGRLAEVFDILLHSFQKTVLNAYKSKFTQFVMFYACALDPEGCGVKFAMVLADIFVSDVNPPITRMSAVAYLASYLSRAKFLSAALVTTIIQSLVDQCYAYCKLRDSGMNPRAHQVFYSGCQAIMYILCFRMRSLMDVPRLKLQLLNMPMEAIWKHKLCPLKVCLPTVVVEFLRQAKAAKLFMASESFVFNDMLESDLSKAFGGMDRLDMFFPFDPCLLKKSESYIRPHFVRWSKVRTTYDDDDDNVSEVSESGSEATDDDFVDTNTKDMIDDDMMVTVEDLDFNPDLNKMSITPKNSLKHLRMPARIRPSTSPESL
ncbi:RNA polymerase I-specific transcription initiation factor RRN3-like [Vigna radiata var. radiata]|uniref:RNA polymerase I-specific transcription initiation factor RRN3-like n=1 Tax=Vigna radiata var. radiata TaxID=3916 RepID=A0A1S3VEE2_VIGRR|nr:RNA polymerase I-specific transcription initiation factor RRN3-like [Vigna radiata var. radiata]